MPPRLSQDHVFVRRALLVFALALSFVFLLWFVTTAVSALLLIFAAILVAIALDGLADLLRRGLGMQRHMSVIVTATSIALLLGVGITATGVDVASQAPELQKQVAQSVDNISATLRSHALTRNLLKQTGPGGQDAMSAHSGEQFTSELSNVATVTLSSLADIVLTIIIGLYLALQPHMYVDGLMRLFAASRQEQIADISTHIARALKRWLVGRGISMLLVAIASALGLWLIGIQFALLLGLIAGLLTFVPYLGAIASAVPAMLVAGLHGFSPVIYVASLYLGLHIVEGYLLMPLVQRRAVSLAPGFLLMAQVVGGALAGIMGVTLATPIALVLAVIVQIGYVRNIMGDEPHLPGEWQIPHER